MPPPPSLSFYPAYCFSASPTFSTWAKLTAVDVHTLTTREGFEAQKIYFYLNHPIKWVRLVGVIVAFDASDYRFTFCLDDSSGKIVEVTCPRDRTGVTGVGPSANNAHDLAISKTPAQLPSFKGRTLSGISVDLAGFDVGSVVKVKGGVGAFRGGRQVELERISTFSLLAATHLHSLYTVPLPNLCHPAAGYVSSTDHRLIAFLAPVRTTTAEAAAWREALLFHSAVLSAPWTLTPDEQRLLKEEADGTAQRAEEKVRRKAERETKRRKHAEREKTAQAGRRKRTEHDEIVQERGAKRRVSDKENEKA
ncbi:hypothetical protein MMC17_005448 [Xylographa soralifera]|nr:hypothetical protein [Xylographa soralifera]